MLSPLDIGGGRMEEIGQCVVRIADDADYTDDAERTILTKQDGRKFGTKSRSS